MKELLNDIYFRLFKEFGDRYWWPAETRDEVIIGAILTQNVSWKNVKKAIVNLKQHDLLDLKAIHKAEISEIAPLIIPTRFYNQKSQKLKNFSEYLLKAYSGSLDSMFSQNLEPLRKELLNINGLGNETVDSILLYAGDKLVFVIDAYTMRILPRLGIGNKNWKYADYQKFIMDNIDPDLGLYKDFHAQIVHLGNRICKGNNPNCAECPLIICKYRYKEDRQASL